MPPPTPLLHTVQYLWENETMLLHGQLLHLEPADEAATVDFLKNAYLQEAISYPHTPPGFDEAAALWAAKTLYIAAQLLLNRTHQVADLPALFPKSDASITPNAILSADLALRFMPDLITHAQAIDTTDGLLPLLHSLMQTWHYSGIACVLEIQSLNFGLMEANPCLWQLYANRTIQYQRLPLTEHPPLKAKIQANLGAFSSALWKDFYLAYEATNHKTV